MFKRERRERNQEMKELERERMLRVEAEQRLQDTKMESDTCRARLKTLQEECSRMEERVESLLQYKTKIEQLKQEKSNLSSTYESTIQKHRNHISKLERENILLLNQVKKLESQLNTKSNDCSGPDKSKLLMERLKILEAENSGLVLENEQQRQQYEKCLDEIANQVVQALLAQKSLRAECTKLQGRVNDLELQNQQLRTMFQTRIRYASDSHLQKTSPMSCESSRTNTLGSSVMSSYWFPPVQHRPCYLPQYPDPNFIPETNFLGSLQSMNSDYSFDECLGHPQMSSPPPWLRDKLEEKMRNSGEFQTKIETEFPASNSSPKMKHISVQDRTYGSWGRTPPKPQRKGKAANNKSPRSSQNMSHGASAAVSQQPHQKSPDKNIPSPMPKPTSTQTTIIAARSNSNSPNLKQPFRSQYFYDYSDDDSDCRPMTLKEVSSSSTVSLNELLDSSLEGADLPTDEDFYSDWSPKSMSPKPLPTDLSAMKTMQNFMYPPLKNSIITNSSIKQNGDSKSVSHVSSITSTIPSNMSAVVSSFASNGTIVTSSHSSDLYANVSSHANSVKTTSTNQGKKQIVSVYGYTNGASPKSHRPDNLILAPRDKNFMLSSLSSSSSEENKTLSSSSPKSNKSFTSQTSTTSCTSPVKKSSPTERRIPKSKHYVQIQVKKPAPEVKKRAAVGSTNKSKVATIVPTPRSPKKSPPPVPKKPTRSNIPAAIPRVTNSKVDSKTSDGAKNLDKSSPKKIQGIVNPIVNPIVNSVIVEPNNFPVIDTGFGPKWPTPETNLDSVRVERSGSRDDGYSTMSSDIQPEAMEKFSDAATVKKCDVKVGEGRQDLCSDPDSAMENSSHSAELQNSTHSLSSQVSTSSGEVVLSPGNKVRDMRMVFEEDTQTIKSAKKSLIPVMKSPLGPKLQFFQSSDSRSLENLPAEKIEEPAELTVKTSWNYHSFNESKIIPTSSIRYNYLDNQSFTLPLGEDNCLEDIPEDRELETKPHVPVQIYDPFGSPPSPPTVHKTLKIQDGHRLKRTASDSHICLKTNSRAATLFDDFVDGQWNNAKIFERSISVSEMDMIDSVNHYEKSASRCPWPRSDIDIDQLGVEEKVKNIIKVYLMSKMSMTSSTTDSDSDSDLETFLKVNKKWMSKNGGYRLPAWKPRETLESLKKSSTPSPVSIKNFDASTPEDWLLKFSKEEIDSHLATASLNSSSLHTSDKQNPYMAYSDLSHFASSSDTSTVIGDDSPEKSELSGAHNLDSSSCENKGNSFVSEEGNNKDGSQSLSSNQKKFHSEFYSLCLVESNRSLVSSSSHETDIHKLVANQSSDSRDMVTQSVKDREFDEITRQIQSLSKTVNDLHKSLSSLNSADSESRDSLMDCHITKSVTEATRNSMDGYHWEEDNYYLTSCGGEVIIGSSSMMDHNNCSNWVNGLETGSNHDDSCDMNEEFYEIQVNGENCTEMSGYVYNGNYSDEVGLHDSSFEPCESDIIRSSSTNQLADSEYRANLLDSMFTSGAESNDSLTSDIGLDSMMCQRLVGRKARHEALRCTAVSLPRQPLDFSKFFIRFDQPEKEAVAAFNFLEDISTSTSESGSEQRLFKPEEDHSGRVQTAEVYIVDNHVGRSRRGDKLRRRKKVDQSHTAKQKPVQSPPSLPLSLCGAKKLNESLNTSSESPEICAGNLSLSDSCCESFSSSDQSVNDLTVL